MSSTTVDKKAYESLFVVPPETAQDAVDAFLEKVKATLEQENGVFQTVQVWGRRRMAYPIKRNKDGLYVFFEFEGGNKSVKALETLYLVTDFILRYITTDRVVPAPERKRPEDVAKEAAAPTTSTESAPAKA